MKSSRAVFFGVPRSEEHTAELQSRGLISYAVFCLENHKTTRPAVADRLQQTGLRARPRARLGVPLLLIRLRQPRSTLFPYTTLFRSVLEQDRHHALLHPSHADPSRV